MQALALEELYTQGALFIRLEVGGGKTLLSYLVMTLLAAQRGIILGPSGMLSEMADMHRSYRAHWLPPPRPPKFLGYSALDRTEPDANPLIGADVLFCDESHRLRNRDRVSSRQVAAFRNACPEAAIVCATGTLGRKSVLDHMHQIQWCLGADDAPVPRGRSEQALWAGALDLETRDRPTGVGALADLGGAGATRRDRARDWYRQRLRETPGILLSRGDSCDTALIIDQIVAPVDEALEADFEVFRKIGETPSGDVVSDPLVAWALETDLSLGYYREWDPPPPLRWVTARKEFRGYVRKRIQDTGQANNPLWTESRVMKAHPDAEPVREWLAVRDDYTAAPKVRWRSASVVQFISDWLRNNGPALAFVWSIPFCEALAAASGLTWYGRRGLDSRGKYISNAPAEQSAIVSGQANLEGRNLQQFNRAIYVAPPLSANWLEQAMGRMHRQRQSADVRITYLASSAVSALCLDKALAEAEFGARTWDDDQKICRAEILRATPPVGTYRFGGT